MDKDRSGPGASKNRYVAASQQILKREQNIKNTNTTNIVYDKQYKD